MKMSRCFWCCCTAAILGVTGARSETAVGQDRGDEVTRSAADVQRTESFGQPYERGQGYYDEGYQYGQGSMQGPFQRGYASQSQWDQYGGQWDRFGQQTTRNDWGGGESPAGLGVVLRETSDQGVQVVDVHRGSPAAEAGLRPGDQIVAVNGQRTDSVRELQSRVMEQDPGTRVEIVALRNGREQTFDARLQTRSEALNRQQQAGYQWDYEGGQSQRFQQTLAQDREIRSRLSSLERQLEQLLREVRNLQNSVGSQTTQMNYGSQPQRQARVQDQRYWQDGRQQWDQQGPRQSGGQYFEDSNRRSQDRENQDQFDF